VPKVRDADEVSLHDIPELERYISDIRRFLPIPVAYVTSMSAIVDATDMLLKLLQRADDEVVGRRLHDFFSDPEQMEAVQQQTLEQGSARNVECVLVDGQGREIPVLVHTLVRLDEVGESTGFFISFIDVTRLKEAEQARRQMEQRIHQTQKLESLGILAGGLAHDFNNLLLGVMGNTGLALMKLSPESPVRGHIQQAEKAATRASELANQMLAYSGKGSFVVEPLSLSKVVEEMAHLLEAAISKKAMLRYDFAPDPPRIRGDATQIRQVVMNLITNASDAIGDDNGSIHIATGALEVRGDHLTSTLVDWELTDGLYAYVEVSDTGQGMDSETQQKIFDPFFTTKFTGRGLGLAAVLGIVRGHRGAIKLYSEVGVGTTIRVLLPTVDMPEKVRVASSASIDGWRGEGLILVVDDEEIVRETAREILETVGFDVLLAADGVEGVEVFREHADEVRAVILDMTMPRMNGEEAFNALRQIRPEVRVVLSSGYNELEAIRAFAGKGLAGFLRKPYTTVGLLEILRGILEDEPLVDGRNPDG